jgi:nicotinate-nucleotide adenylyltransferase
MGGTFDPIHHGHLVAASEVAHLFELSRVIFAPTGQPWHKSSTTTAPELRYLMTVIATSSNPRFDVTRVDIDRPGPTYTVDTIADLNREYAGQHSEWFFITGADALSDILQWRDADKVLEQVHFVGVTRPGHDLTDPGLPEGKVTLLEIPALAISSTDIRERVAARAPITYLVPDGVERFIEKQRLYLRDADDSDK